MSLVVPAVLPSSRIDLEEKLALFARMPSVSRVQIDVVDGRFATPASWPYTVPQELNNMLASGEMLPELDRITYEIDLMCFDPESAAESWLALGASRLTFHAESSINVSHLLASARERFGCGFISCGMADFGIALNVMSDLAIIEPYLDQIEYIQFMGIARIGRQGQPFDRHVLDKIRLFHSRHPKIAIQVDGGVSLDTAHELVALGVSNLVVGSAILRASDPVAEVAKFEALHTSFGV
jgi:ribulose-phosphate 3-epimerase